MAFRARYSAPYNAVAFVETAPGVFGAYIAPNANEYVSTTGTTQMAAAVATSAGQGVVTWSNYYNAASGYPEGPILKVTAYSSNANKPGAPTYAYAGPKVTVVDDYGTHVGTPTMSAKYVIPSSASVGAVAVMHQSASDGWTFTGWRVTKQPRLSSSTMTYVSVLSGATGETDGLVTFYPASGLGEAALVIRLTKDSTATMDALLIEAVYEDASTPEPDPDPDPGITSCTVSFAKNGSAVSGDSIPSIEIGIGSSGVLPAPELWSWDGYEFKEWNLSSDGSGEGFSAGEMYYPDGTSESVVLYAIWMPSGGDGARYRRVEDDPDDGSWPRTSNLTYPYVVQVAMGGPVGSCSLKVQTCTVMGYDNRRRNLDTGVVTVDGSGEQGGTVTQSYTVPSSIKVADTQYRTRTQENKYGTSSGSKGYLTTFKYWAYPDRNWTWEAPEIEGFDFIGWYTLDASYSSLPSSPNWGIKLSSERVVTWGWLADRLNYTGSQTTYVNHLQVRYRGKQLSVTFQPNGGECATWRITVYRLEGYGQLPVPSRIGYTFAGWYTERDGGDLVTADTIVQGMEDHTLYAHWSKDPVSMTVHFIPCGGTVSPTTKTVTSGEVYGELPVPVRGDDEFQGWFTASMGGQRVTAATVVGHTYKHWLYAQWPIVPDESEEPDEPDEPDLPEEGGMANLIDLI